MSANDDRRFSTDEIESLRAALDGSVVLNENEVPEGVDAELWAQLCDPTLTVAERDQLIERTTSPALYEGDQRLRASVESWSEGDALRTWADALAEELAEVTAERRDEPVSVADIARNRPIATAQAPPGGGAPWLRPALAAAAAVAVFALGWAAWRSIAPAPADSPAQQTVRGRSDLTVSPAPDERLAQPPLEFRWSGAGEGLGPPERAGAGRLIVLKETGEEVLRLEAEEAKFVLTEPQRALLRNARFVWSVESSYGARVGPFWFEVAAPASSEPRSIEEAGPTDPDPEEGPG